MERGLHDRALDEPLLARILAVTEENLPEATKDRIADAMFALVHFDCLRLRHMRDNIAVTICSIDQTFVVSAYHFLLSSFSLCTGNNYSLTTSKEK